MGWLGGTDGVYRQIKGAGNSVNHVIAEHSDIQQPDFPYHQMHGITFQAKIWPKSGHNFKIAGQGIDLVFALYFRPCRGLLTSATNVIEQHVKVYCYRSRLCVKISS
jgi:hypothetical protein